MAVDPDGGVRPRAIEFNRDLLPPGGFRKREGFAVPAGAKAAERAFVRVQLRIKRTVDRPVVGQTKRRPMRIVEGGLLSSIGLAFEETPVRVEVDAAFAGNLHGAGGSGAREGWEEAECKSG